MNQTLVAPLPEKKLDKHPRGQFHTPGLLARWPLIGVMLVALGGLVFGALAINLQTHGPLLPLDTRVANDLHAIALQSSLAIRQIMIFGFYLGEQGILMIGLLLVLSFLYRRFWAGVVMVVIAWAAEGGIWLYLSQYYDRARPV